MGRPFVKRIGYDILRWLARITAVLLFGVRCHGRDRMPENGAVLVCANHQSFLDPVLVGLAFNRRLNYLARESLFRFAPFRWLIAFLDAIPIDRGGLGMAGLRESLRRLKHGETVLIFPEGTRTSDGSLQPLEPGFCVLARRGGVTLLPVGIDGAYEAWPRRAQLPRPATIHVCVGAPMGPDVIGQVDDAALVEELEGRLRACHAWARESRLRCRAGP